MNKLIILAVMLTFAIADEIKFGFKKLHRLVESVQVAALSNH